MALFIRIALLSIRRRRASSSSWSWRAGSNAIHLLMKHITILRGLFVIAAVPIPHTPVRIAGLAARFDSAWLRVRRNKERRTIYLRLVSIIRADIITP